MTIPSSSDQRGAGVPEVRLVVGDGLVARRNQAFRKPLRRNAELGRETRQLDRTGRLHSPQEECGVQDAIRR